MNVFIHIGFPKTGSTAIQSHIFTNRRWFMDRDVYVPAAGFRAGLGHAFLFPFGSESYSDGNSETVLKGEGALAELQEELRGAEGSGYSRALISSEGLCQVSKAKIAALASALQGHSVTVVAYVREQSALFQSAVIQEMESLKSLSRPLLFHRADPADFTPPYLQFGDVLEHWQRAFPEGTRIDARVYERSRLENGNVVTDFVGSLGLEQDEEFCLQDSRVNHSLDARAAALLLLANAAGAPYEGLLRLSKALSTVSGRTRGTKRFLTTAEIEQLRSHYEADNRKLFADFITSGEGFENPDATAPESSDVAPAGAEELAYYASIYDTLIAPPRELWLGELLTSRPLARIAGAPNAGWRGPEQDGVWSVGSESRLAFQLPQTHAESGPSHLLLTVAGHYTPGNTSTRIRTHQWEMDLSLENAELEIAIDDRVRSEGVEVQLLHHNPQSPDGWQDDPDHGLAFKLQFLRYNFAWNADSPA